MTREKTPAEMKAMLSELIDNQFLIRTYLEAQGLHFLANKLTPAINILIAQRDDIGETR